jgi:hypothetical protein
MKHSRCFSRVAISQFQIAFLTIGSFGVSPQLQTGNHTGPAQPIPYSHKTHLARGLKCETCHSNAPPDDEMTLPAVEVCMACHQVVARNRPSIVKLAEFARDKEPIPWVRVYKLPDGINWSHSPHLSATLKCETCHGDVSKMDVVTRVTNVTAMATCMDCHREKAASTDCSTCHQQ